MKKTYDSYEDAINQQVTDFVVVSDTEMLPDGRVRVFSNIFNLKNTAYV